MKKYKAYVFRGVKRIMGPGLDIWFGSLDCPKCSANFFDIAYKEGYQAGFKRGKK